MGAAEFGAEAFIGALDGLGGTVAEARTATANYSTIDGWIGAQTAQAAVAGAAATAIPGAHLVTVPAELMFLMHKLARCAWGVGALIDRGTPYELPDGKSDLVPILGLWSGEFTEKDLDGIVLASAGTGFVVAGIVYPEFGAAVVAKGVGKAAAAAVSATFGTKAGAKAAGTLAAAGSKAAAKAALLPLFHKVSAWVLAKTAAKGASGFLPFVGPVVAAGINTYFVVRFGKCAATYYRAKLATLRGQS